MKITSMIYRQSANLRIGWYGIIQKINRLNPSFRSRSISLSSSMLVGLLLCMVLPSWLEAQTSPTNGNRYNSELRTKNAYWNNCTESSGDSEIAFVANARPFTNHGATVDQILGTSPKCLKFQKVCRCICSNTWGETLHTRLNSESKQFDLAFASWENDTGINCVIDIGDDAVAGTKTHPAAGGLPCAWEDRLKNNTNGSRLDYQTIWRYTNGTKDSPLTFGSISGEAAHINSTNKGASSSSGMSYGSDYDRTILGIFTDAPDVSYTFEIVDPAEITLSTDYAETNFSPGIHLLEKLLSGGNGIGTLVVDLIPGIYTIIIDGNEFTNNSTGDFKLSISPKPLSTFSFGTIAISGETGICAGAELGAISNVTSPTFLGKTPTYQWQERISGVWRNIGGATSASLSAPGNMVMADRKFRRAATVVGVTDYSNEVTFKYVTEVLNAGQIQLSDIRDVLIPSGTSPAGITSQTPATGGSDNITYEWQQSIGNGTWDPVVPSATGASFSPGMLTSTAQQTSFRYRRKAKHECAVKYTDPVEINVYLGNGGITGKVTGRPLSGSFPVAGVTVNVCRTSPTQGDHLAATCYEGVTGTDGTYTIPGIYYGPNGANFTVTPFKEDGGIEHGFDPDSRTTTLSSSIPTVTSGMDFVDTTVFNFSGSIYQTFPEEPGKKCAMDSVTLWRSSTSQPESVLVFTTAFEHGEEMAYAIDIPSPGTYTIEARYRGGTFHSFSDIEINSDQEGMDFVNNTTHIVTGYFGGSCPDNKTLGRVKLTFTDLINCADTTVTTEDTDTFSVTLPARRYSVEVTDFMPKNVPYGKDDVVNFFIANPLGMIDLRDEDISEWNIIYHPPPVITVNGFPEPLQPCVDGPIVMEQFVPLNLTVLVTEGVSGGCEVDTGFISVTDNISDLSGQNELAIANGRVTYTLVPGEPNLSGNPEVPGGFLKNLFITATDVFGQSTSSDPPTPTTYSKSVIITGALARETNFVTVTPEIPLLILHDPPGDNSYSFVEQGNTMETATSMSVLKDESTSLWGKVKLGVQFEFGGLGFSSESEVWGEVGGAETTTSTNTTIEEQIWSFTMNQRFETSDDPEVIGASGDLFVGSAINMLYAAADIIGYDTTTCKVTESVDIIMAADGLDPTLFIYTEQHIRETLIDKLRFLEENTANPDSMLYYANQRSVWQQTLQRNDLLKADAVPYTDAGIPGNISFNGGSGPAEFSTTTTTTKNSTLEFAMEFEREIAIEAGLEIGGSGLSGGYISTVRMETGESETTAQTNEFTAGFVLQDDDGGDDFTVGILVDPVYQTPVFEYVAGQSSCPYEDDSVLRYKSSIKLQTGFNPEIRNVPTDELAEFKFEIGNISESDEALSYYLRLRPGSNSDGANISLNGSPYLLPIPSGEIEKGDAEVFTVTVGMPNGASVTSYAGIAFDVYANCDNEVDFDKVLDSYEISVFFQSACSDVTLVEPNPLAGNAVVNAASNNLLDVKIGDYDVGTLNEVDIKIRAVGSGNWFSLGNVTADNLSTTGASPMTTIPVNLGAYPDGAYELRLQLSCNAGIIYSQRAAVLIDREAPVLLGTPQPIDDNYDLLAGDKIAAAFNELIDCSNSTISLIDLNSQTVIPAVFGCFSNEVLITPNNSLPDGLYQITVENIMDVNRNTVENVSWIFTAGDYTPCVTCPGNKILDLCAGDLLPDLTGLAEISNSCVVSTITQTPPAGTSILENTTVTLTGGGNFCIFEAILHTATIVSSPAVCSGTDAVFTVTGTDEATLTYTTGTGNSMLDLNGSNQTITIPGITTDTELTLVSINKNECVTNLNISATVMIDNSSNCQDDCPASIDVTNLNDGFIASGTYKASTHLTSSGIVQSGNSVSFKAGNTITLGAGFHAQAGSDFLAMIEACEAVQTIVEEETLVANKILLEGEALAEEQAVVTQSPLVLQKPVEQNLISLKVNPNPLMPIKS